MPGKFRSFIKAIFGESTTATDPTDVPASNAYDIGLAIGMTGGSVADAAKLQYVLSRVVPPGQAPTSAQISRIVGMLGSGVSEAVIIDSLLKDKRSGPVFR